MFCVCVTCLKRHGSHAVVGLWLLLSTGLNTLFPVLNCNKHALFSSENKAEGYVEAYSIRWSRFGCYLGKNEAGILW